MKPKDLKRPFTWEERRPCFQDGVLFVPEYFTEHDKTVMPSLDIPVNIEYCSGNGNWLVERAEADQKHLWIGVEIRFDRVRKIWAKMRNRGLQNLLIVCGDAWTFTHHYLADRSIDEAYINFPDPWPKARHEKHRLMAPKFIRELTRVLTGGVTFVTDDQPYLGETISYLRAEPQLKPSLPAPHFVTEMTNYGSSYFDALWREKGRTIHYATFRKNYA